LGRRCMAIVANASAWKIKANSVHASARHLITCICV
jgi:hypothetical protein